MSSKRVEALLAKKVVDISAGFPASDGEDYLALALGLFRAGVFRVPIIGIKDNHKEVKTLALFSDGVQEHAQLAKVAQIDPKKIIYTTSIEGYPFNKIEDIYSIYLKILVGEEDAYQRFGLGSDYFSQGLNSLGAEEISRIFVQIGALSNY